MSRHREVVNARWWQYAWLLSAGLCACSAQPTNEPSAATALPCAGMNGQAACATNAAQPSSSRVPAENVAQDAKPASGTARGPVAISGNAAAGTAAHNGAAQASSNGSAGAAAGSSGEACSQTAPSRAAAESSSGSAGATATSHAAASENAGAAPASRAAAAGSGSAGATAPPQVAAASGSAGAAAPPQAAGSGNAGATAPSAGAACSPAAESGNAQTDHASAGTTGAHAGTGATDDKAASSGASDPCAAQGLLFCDDFESQPPGAPPAAPWTIANNGMGHANVATDAAHSGKASIKVTSEGGYQTFFALTSAPVFPHDGALYLRLYIRLDAPMTAGHNTYYKAGAGGAASSEHETRMGVMNGMLMINQPAGDRGFLSNEDYYRDGNMPGVVFAPMTWVCVETFFDPANKTIDVWVDGSEVPDLHRTDWEQDPIGALHFGFEKYAGPDATIWYDDIALSTQAIGCR